MGDTFLYNGDYGDLTFDIVKKLVQEDKDFDQFKEEIEVVVDQEIESLMRTLAWWIIIKRMLDKIPDYQNILSWINKNIRKIKGKEEEEEKNRVVDIEKFLKN